MENIEINNQKKNMVSVIVRSYNVIENIKQSLDSIINQTYKNLEIIIIDDGSTDKTVEILKKYRDTNDNIKLKELFYKTPGNSNVYNIGLNIAKGKYIYFIDGNDYIEKNTIKILLNNAIKNSSDIVISNYYNIINNKKVNSLFLYKLFQYDNYYNNLLENNNIENLSLINPSPWNKLYKKSFLKNKDIKFTTGDHLFEDYYWHWLNIINTNKISIISDKLIYHSENEDLINKNYDLFHYFSVFYLIRNKVINNNILNNIFLSWIKNNNFVNNILLNDKKLHNKIKRIYNNFINNKTTYIKDLSIIIPVYKLKDYKFLDELTQKLSVNNNIEIIFINDNGVKENKLEEYYKKYNNVFLINNSKNIGGGRSRNKAIPIIEGKYTHCLDCDDKIYIDKYLKEFNLLKKDQYKYDILYFNFTVNKYQKYISDTNNLKCLFPWFYFVKSSIVHDNSIFFGVTDIVNDLNYTMQVKYFSKVEYTSKEYIYDYNCGRLGSLSSKKDRTNTIHSFYHTYLKLLDINFDNIRNFINFKDMLINKIISNNKIDEKKISYFDNKYFNNVD